MKREITVKKEIDLKYVICDLGVRYFEDGMVNGVEDNPTTPKMPGVYTADDGKKRLRLCIDVDNGQIIDWPKGTTASVHYKICDDGSYTFMDVNDEVIAKGESYVPEFLCLNENGYGDYAIFDVDTDGFIKDWDFGDSDDFQRYIENFF